MIIREIKIQGLFGYINKHIKFHKDLNLLVGINGSGKTSVLNLVSWMLTPSLPELAVTQFKRISLGIIYNRIKYELVCEQKDRRMFYHILRAGKKVRGFHPLEIALIRRPKILATKSEIKKKAMESYQGLQPTVREFKTFTFLQDIPSPVILGLDRTVSRESKDPSTQRQQSPVSSVEQLQDLANTKYNIYQSRMIDLSNSLRDKIMLSAFDVSRLDSTRKPLAVKLAQIEKWRVRFNNYMSQSPKSKTLVQTELRNSARRYFDKLETLLGKRFRSAANQILLSTEFLKLRRMIVHLEKFERESENAFAPIKSYLDTLNKFFKDSSKRLLFKEDTNQICFQVLNEKNEPIGQLRNVEVLSSGERQLLSLFTFIRFSVGGIFIIDEPELSLHPKWQDNFLDAIKVLTPANTQLILATHSPAIVGKNRANCITLLPYNK